MKDEILIDARWLEPPEPMEKVMQALDKLLPGQPIRMLLHREPFPLYSILDNRGYRHTSRVQADGTYEIHIQDVKSVLDEQSLRNASQRFEPK